MSPGPLAALAGRPDSAPVLAWPGGEIRAGELLARVEELAAAMRADAHSPGPIAVVSPRRLDLLLGVLAALRLGRPALPLDPSRADFEACLEQCAVTVVLRPSASAPSRIERLPLPVVPSPVGDPPALLVPTSGTGGATRIAMLPASRLDAHVAASARHLPPLEQGARWLVCLPVTSIGALAALWRCLSAGSCFVFLEEFDAEAARALMAGGVSHVSVVPAMIAALAEATAMPAPRGLRCLLSGGGALSSATAGIALARGWPLWNAWGMTETASHVAAGPVDAGWLEGVGGRPLPGVELGCEPGGRVSIAGPMLMSGYANPALMPGIGLEPDGRFLSGDLGERLEDGSLRLLGRADDVIVSGGINIHPEIVEEALSHCAGAGEVGVLGRPDPRWGQCIVAVYTGPANPAALAACAEALLPAALRPREFLRVARLPRNPMGKLLRRQLAAAIAQDGATGAPDADVPQDSGPDL